MPLRALGDRAVSDRVGGAMWPFLLTLGGLAGIVAVLVIRHLVRSRRTRTADGPAAPPVDTPHP